MKSFIPIFLLLLSWPLFSQQQSTKADSSRTETMLADSVEADVQHEKNLLHTPVHHGFYGALETKSASIGPSATNSLLTSAQAGWILNRKYVIGLKIGGLASRVKAPPLPQINGLILIQNYGGLYLSYVHNSPKLVHLEIGSLFGLGQVFYRDAEYRARYKQIDAYLIIEPGVAVILNIVPGFRLGGGLSYRYTDRVNLIGLTDADLSGISVNLIAKIGKF